jgi:hypothetical protein
MTRAALRYLSEGASITNTGSVIGPFGSGRLLDYTSTSAKRVAEFGRDTDLKRAAQPEELTLAFAFPAGPCWASYIQGSCSRSLAASARTDDLL